MKGNQLLREVKRDRELSARLRDEIWEKQMVQSIQKRAKKRMRKVQFLSAAVLLVAMSAGLFFWERVYSEDQLYSNIYQAMLEPAYSGY